MTDKLDLDALATTVQTEIASSRRYQRQSGTQQNERPIKYLQGDMDQYIPHDEGRSGVVSHDVADTIGWMMPDIVRLFFAGDRIVDYQPQAPEDEEFTEQASDYINHVFLNDCRGYFVFWDAAHDGLSLRNGIMKAYWDDDPQYKTRDLSGLHEEQLQMLVNHPHVEVLEYSSETTVINAPEDGGEPVEIPTHSVKIRQMTRQGRIKVVSVPPEEYLIDTQAKDIHDARFHCHRYLSTRSDLIKDGFDREKVEDVPMSVILDTEEERLAREDDDDTTFLSPRTDRAMETVEVHECYMLFDINDDGIAEWCQVIMAGGQDSRSILHWEEWGDPIPFVDLCPERVPHRFEGRSVYDQTHDVQEVKTVLLRGVMDNLYDIINPERVAIEKEVVNPDALLNPRYGEVHRVKTDINAIKELPKQFVAAEAFSMLDYWDQMAQKRTGVSPMSAVMDPEKLQNQSATAANISQGQAHSKVELVGRNYKEGGMKDLFRIMLQLAVNHQDMPVTVKLRNKWVTVNPSMWNPEMDAVINTGLGTGNRERDLAFLFRILEIQKEIVSVMGPDNPVVKPSQVHNTLEKIVHGSGISSADMFFTEVPDEVMAKWWAQKQEEQKKAAQEMDGQTQAFVQVEQMKAQLKDQEAKMKAAIDQMELEHKQEMESLKMEKEAAELGVKNDFEREKLERELAFQAEQKEEDRQVQRENMAFTAQLEQLKLSAAGDSKPDQGVMSDIDKLVNTIVEQAQMPRRVVYDAEGNVERIETA